jgi:hypothetical protein
MRPFILSAFLSNAGHGKVRKLELRIMTDSTTAIEGVIVPLLTPVDQEECVDVIALRTLIRHCIKGGADGLLSGVTDPRETEHEAGPGCITVEWAYSYLVSENAFAKDTLERALLAELALFPAIADHPGIAEPCVKISRHALFTCR